MEKMGAPGDWEQRELVEGGGGVDELASAVGGVDGAGREVEMRVEEVEGLERVKQVETTARMECLGLGWEAVGRAEGTRVSR
ncbi:MAG: hypothetical protein SGPRY_001424, partial [Prymnesium sp.]